MALSHAEAILKPQPLPLRVLLRHLQPLLPQRQAHRYFTRYLEGLLRLPRYSV